MVWFKTLTNCEFTDCEIIYGVKLIHDPILNDYKDVTDHL